MAILKGLEVSILRERTMKGLDAARARGRKTGSYNKVTAAVAATLYQKGGPVTEILATLRISRATLYEYLKIKNVNYKCFKKKL